MDTATTSLVRTGCNGQSPSQQKGYCRHLPRRYSDKRAVRVLPEIAVRAPSGTPEHSHLQGQRRNGSSHPVDGQEAWRALARDHFYQSPVFVEAYAIGLHADLLARHKLKVLRDHSEDVRDMSITHH